MQLSYIWQDRIGKGGYGKVFAAKITKGARAGMDVALKKARVTNHIRHPVLLHEAYALVLLRGHANIPRVLAWGRSQYFEYLVMDLLGPNIADVVKEVGLTLRNAVALLVQMLDALEFVHGQGLVHCDVKPSNIVLARSDSDNDSDKDNAGRLYLIDFGLASRWTSDPKSQSQRCDARGTIHYSSLRVLAGKAPLPRDDLESLAYTVARVATGTLPWVSSSSRQRLERGTVAGGDLFRIASRQGDYPDVFARFADFACGLAPADDPQYQRWRDAFRSSLSEHPLFDREDRSGGGPPCWVRCTAPFEKGGSHLRIGRGEDGYYDKDVLGGDSRSGMGGDHGFDGLEPSEWYFPVALSPCWRIGDELDLVSRHLEFVDEPPVYNGGRSVEDRSPPEVMNNTQSDTHCIRA